jgi:hypothetical protein
LVHVVVEAICSDRDHMNDGAGCDGAVTEWDRRARGVLGKL